MTQDNETVELQDAANEIIGRKDWPHGETNRPPRLFLLQLEQQVDTVGLSRLLNAAGRILSGRLNASKANRAKVGNQLLSVNDRMVEFQELYDRTIPRGHEYDPNVNPQRTGNGMLLYVETTKDQLDSLVESLVEPTLPFKLSKVMPSANDNDWVSSVNNMRVVFPTRETVLVSCVMKVERRGDTEVINTPSVFGVKDVPNSLQQSEEIQDSE